MALDTRVTAIHYTGRPAAWYRLAQAGTKAVAPACHILGFTWTRSAVRRQALIVGAASGGHSAMSLPFYVGSSR